MTKRNSVETVTDDVDMVDPSPKKLKAEVYAYPNDNYTITCDFIKNSSFEILYMACRARAEVPRMILEYVGAKYTSAAPVDWPASKKDTPFGLLPLLSHTKPDGKVFTVSEVPALTRYLARMFGMTGSNVEQDALIDSCYNCGTQNILDVMMTEVWMKPNPKDKKCIDTAFEKMVLFFDGFERYLEANGSNGYLLGEKTTYGEFPWYDWMEHFYSEYPENMKSFVSETVRPSTYKLYKRFESNPRIQAYIKGGRWEYRPTKEVLGFYAAGVIVSDWDRAMEFYRDTLEFEVVKEASPPGGKYAEFKVHGQDTTRFTIFCSATEKMEIPKNGGLALTVRDVKGTHDKLVKKGVESKMPPTTMPWGMMAQIADPDGNIFNLHSV